MEVIEKKNNAKTTLANDEYEYSLEKVLEVDDLSTIQDMMKTKAENHGKPKLRLIKRKS